MSPIPSIRLYSGQGKTLKDRGLEMPLFEPNPDLFAAEHYCPDENLIDAVNVALTLGMPLLVTGEPGTGKTQLADSIAWELGLGKPLVFSTKSTSTYTDLFYQYDALRHFRDVQIEAAARKNGLPGSETAAGQAAPDTAIENYITFGPLGRAILFAMDRSHSNCPPELRERPQRRSVVLIDELDKAPRDLPNDILNEVERMEFQIKELPPERSTFQAAAKYRPILILTSNLEKDLPDAFRRRCVFYHIEFEDLDLKEIVRRRLPRLPEFTEPMLEHALGHFRDLRQQRNLDKKPATAELLAWIDLLQRLRLDVKDVKDLDKEDRLALAASYAILAKSDDDLKKLRQDAVSRPADGEGP
jgi:MoxR-like ATPase